MQIFWDEKRHDFSLLAAEWRNCGKGKWHKTLEHISSEVLYASTWRLCLGWLRYIFAPAHPQTRWHTRRHARTPQRLQWPRGKSRYHHLTPIPRVPWQVPGNQKNHENLAQVICHPFCWGWPRTEAPITKQTLWPTAVKSYVTWGYKS